MDKRFSNIKGRVMPGKWYYYIGIHPDYQRLEGYRVAFEVFKMKKMPPEGVEYDRRYYDGVQFRARVAVDKWR